MKKIFWFFVSLLTIYLHTVSTSISAKDYCNLYLDESYIDTMEIPFYLYTNTKEKIIEQNMSIKEEYTSSKLVISSTTICESINKQLYTTNTTNKYFSVSIDYSYEPYPSYLTDFTIHENSKLKANNSLLKATSTIIDDVKPTFYNFFERYEYSIDNPLNFDDILSSIQAYDDVDHTITSKIKVEYNDYDPTTIGTYPITLSVEDSSYNKTYLKFYIIIKDLTPPIIEGKSEYISYLSSKLNEQEIINNLKVYDNVDNNLEEEIYLSSGFYDPSKIGAYTLYYRAMDLSGNLSIPFEITIQVIDDIPPTIEGLNYYTSTLSNPLTLEEILYSLSAYDIVDYDVSSNIFIFKDYYSNFTSLGETSLLVKAYDSSNNYSAPFKVTINVIDDVKPQLFGPNHFTSYMSNNLSLSYIKQQIKAIDNIDGDISDKIFVLEDSYSSNFNKVGTFYITLQVEDYSNNLSEPLKISIDLVDDMKPYFLCDKNEQIFLINKKPPLNQLLIDFKALDNVDGDITNLIEIQEDSYSHSQEEGTYYISLIVKDSSMNESLPYKIKITLVNSLLETNEISLYLPTSSKLTITEINKLINFNEENYTITLNTYETNYNIEGSYKIEYNLNENKKMLLNVITYLKEQPTLVNQKTKVSLIQKIKLFFINIFSFFKTLFNKIKIKWFS